MRHPRLFWATSLAAAVGSRIIAEWLLALLNPEPATAETIRKAIFESHAFECLPEPREQAAYALAVLLPVALVFGAVLVFRHFGVFRAAESRSLWLGGAALLAQLALIGFAGHAWLYESEHSWTKQLNNVASAQLAIGACVACYWGVRWLRPEHKERLARIGQRFSRAPWLAWTIAVSWAVAQLLCCVFTDANIGKASGTVAYHLQFTMDEFAAVANGRFPLVDFYSQYQSLLGHLLRPFFSIAGLSVTTFTAAMSALSLVGFLLLYQVFSRVAASAWLGLLLYLPFVPFSLANVEVPGTTPGNSFNYYAVGPIRYFGVFLIAYLSMRYLTRPQFKRLAMVSFVAGLVVLNNLDFGIAAAAGLLLCCIIFPPASASRTRFGQTLRAAGVFSGGIALAFAAFALGTKMASGAWPNFNAMTEFQRAFAVLGFNMLPLPKVGLYWIVYLTFMVAVLYAIFDGFSEDEGSSRRLSTGMLAYAGVSGLGVLVYYIGRSHQSVLVTIYAAWAFALALLVHRMLADFQEARDAYPSGGYAVHAVPVVAALGLCCGLLPPVLELPKLGQEYERLSQKGPKDVSLEPLAALVAKYVKKDAPTVIIWSNPHRLGLLASVENWYPFNHANSMLLNTQVRRVLDRVDRLPKGTQYVFGELVAPISEGLTARGFTPVEAIGTFGCWRGPETPADAVNFQP